MQQTAAMKKKRGQKTWREYFIANWRFLLPPPAEFLSLLFLWFWLLRVKRRTHKHFELMTLERESSGFLSLSAPEKSGTGVWSTWLNSHVGPYVTFIPIFSATASILEGKYFSIFSRNLGLFNAHQVTRVICCCILFFSVLNGILDLFYQVNFIFNHPWILYLISYILPTTYFELIN